MARSKPDLPEAAHVSLYGRDVVCYHCGAREEISSGAKSIPIDMLLSASAPFARAHTACPETPESPTLCLEGDEFEWERGLFVGLSSATIFSVMVGRPPLGIHSRELGLLPQDTADFGRCHRLLRVKPAWRGRLDEVAQKHPAWRAILERWDTLAELYEAKDGHAVYDLVRATHPTP